MNGWLVFGLFALWWHETLNAIDWIVRERQRVHARREEKERDR